MDLQGNIYGGGSDAVGSFTISGTWSDEVQFSKQYTGAHAVMYKGKADNGNKVVGTWEIPGNCDGTFWLEMEILQWMDWYKQKDFKDKMEFKMVVDPKGVFGAGCDSVGKFLIRGYHDPNQS